VIASFAWPGFLGLYATNDFETADGAIDAFNNRLRGFKEIRMVTGYHFGLAYETARFALEVVFNRTPSDNTQTTTYAREVCDAESVLMDPATQSIVGVPSVTIQDANRKVDDFIARWVRSERHRSTRERSSDKIPKVLSSRAAHIHNPQNL
jgi:hypothetical protein